MNHLYFLTTNLSITKNIIHELRDKGIQKKQLHIMGNNSYLINKSRLNEANCIQTSDLVPSLKRGALFGIFNSLIFCTLYYYLEFKYDLKINLLIMAALIFMGVILGAWASSLIGISLNTPFIEKFQSLINEGFYIIIADAQNESDINIIKQVALNHPELKFGTDDELEQAFH